MARFKSRKAVLILGLALVLAAGGVAISSNMGFKYVKSYTGGGTGFANTLSLPYFQTQFPNAHVLFNDITGATRVCKVQSNGALACWLGDFNGGIFFNITNENGYIVNVASNTTEVIVGSHDPGLAISLTGGGTAFANFKSLPYHMTYTAANQIFNDIPGAVRVCKIQSNGALACWLGDFNGGIQFSTIIGDAVVINVTSTTTWTPDHY